MAACWPAIVLKVMDAIVLKKSEMVVATAKPQTKTGIT